MIYESYHMSADEGQEELEEVNEELRKREEKESRGGLESGPYKSEETAFSVTSKIFIQAFTITTLAEWRAGPSWLQRTSPRERTWAASSATPSALAWWWLVEG